MLWVIQRFSMGIYIKYKLKLLQKEGISIKKTLYYIQLYSIFSLFWIALFEHITTTLLISAPIVSIIIVFISEKFFIQDSYYNAFYFNTWKMLKYFFVLVFEIYKSSLTLIPKIFEGKAKSRLVSIKTSLKKPEHIAILANSITLTPGTITVDVSENDLLVLWFNPQSIESEESGDMIKGSLENILKEDPR